MSPEPSHRVARLSPNVGQGRFNPCVATWAPAPPWSYHPSEPTFDVVGTVIELQLEDIIAGAVGIQGARDLAAADEAMLPTEHNDGTVDELHEEELRVPCPRKGEGR